MRWWVRLFFLLFEGRGDAPQTSAMSDKLQFVAGKPKEALKRLSDKLKFVGHLDYGGPSSY